MTVADTDNSPSIHQLRKDLTAGSARASLTDRERGVLAWAARGKTVADTAVILAILPEIVETHLRNAMRKLGASNKTHAAVMALKLGLIDAGRTEKGRTMTQSDETKPDPRDVEVTERIAETCRHMREMGRGSPFTAMNDLLNQIRTEAERIVDVAGGVRAELAAIRRGLARLAPNSPLPM